MFLDSGPSGKGPLRTDEAICYVVLSIMAILTLAIILLEVFGDGTFC